MAKCVAPSVFSLLLWGGILTQAFRRECPLSRNRYRVEYRPASGQFFLLGGDEADDEDDSEFVDAQGGGRSRAMMRTEHWKLRGDPVELVEQKGSLSFTSDIQDERYLATSDAVSRSIYLTARSCNCHHAPEPHPFCIVGVEDAESAQDLEVFSVGVTDSNTCGIPRDTEQTVVCYHNSRRVEFARNSWPVIVLWYVVLIVYVCSTSAGRYARDYFLSFMCSRRNDRIVEAQLRRELEIRDRVREARAIERLRIRLAAIAAGDQSADEPLEQSLVLRTRTYKQPKSAAAAETSGESKNVAEDEFNDSGSLSDERLFCTICMVEVVDNDRVGILPCNHIFHVECLKEWIKRRNVCPLCQEPGIAAPHQQSSEGGSGNDTSPGEQRSQQQRAPDVTPPATEISPGVGSTATVVRDREADRPGQLS